MKNIVLEKIANLKESLIRRDEMKEVESQVQDIFKMIDSIESKEEKQRLYMMKNIHKVLRKL